MTDAIGFVLRLGKALHAYGYAAHRLEEVLGAVAQQIGLEAQFFSTPTAISAAFGPQDDQRTFLIRVEPGDVDLGKMAALDRVTLDVLHGTIAPAEGSRRIAAIEAAPARYGPGLTTFGFGLASGAAARFLGGGPVEVIVATVIGLAIGLLAAGAARLPAGAARVFEPAAAFLAVVMAQAAAHFIAPHSVFIAVLAGLIVLIPGLTLTVAMTELATRHLASGTARLSAAVMVFLSIIFGVALGNGLVEQLLGALPTADPPPMPVWTELVALGVAPVGFAILLRAEPRDFGWIALAGWLAFAGARTGALLLGPNLGSFLGALAVGVASNLDALWRDRPAQITQVPGVLLLVPGSIGFRSLASLLDREVVLGVETAFTMALVASAIVAGLLIANVVVPRRKSG